MTYSQKLRDPRWQKMRLQILERDKWACKSCGSTENNLQVHHVIYLKREPWDYPQEYYQTLCCDCHSVRQELIDNASNAFKLALKDKPTSEIQSCAQMVFEFVMMGGVK
jgi:5-methylcytosine-specific restriction endonuclease McrA